MAGQDHTAARPPVATGPLASGLLFVDKPAGRSSHDIVALVRRAARSKRVGHAGTLDPFATGLLVIAVGPCTRLLPYVHGEPKVYEAVFRFGHETDTDDATGDRTREAALPPAHVLQGASDSVRREAEAVLTGEIAQIPPAYSAKHVNGQRAYDLARKGRDVDLPPVTVHVHRWEWLAGTADTLTTRITCGGGTYIRALARDLGRALGSAAHCESLRRVSSGRIHVRDAVPVTELSPGAIADGLVPLHSPAPALEGLVREELDDAQLAHLRVGRPIGATQAGPRAMLIAGGEIVAIAERTSGDRWQPRVVLLGHAP